MVGTINPAVSGGRRGLFLAVASAHTLGCLLSGAAVGAVLGLLGWLVVGPDGLPPILLALPLAVTCLAYAAHHAGKIELPMPCMHRQVLHGRRFQTPVVGAFGYGFGLGSGLQVHIRFAGLYVVVLAAVLSGDAWIGAWLLGVYGVCRSLPVWVYGFLHRQPKRTEATFEWLSTERNFGMERFRVLTLVGTAVWVVLASFAGLTPMAS